MKGKLKWYNSYKVSLTHLLFHLSLMAVVLIMWIQIWSVILGQSMVGTGRANFNTISTAKQTVNQRTW